jgi:hypothetical protein
MQRKILYTAALILCLSALASSHECSWHEGQTIPGKPSVKMEPAAQAVSDPTLEYPLLRVLYV